jgi:Tol biopolymer transport system component
LDESPSDDGVRARGSPADRLDSWKKIASYLKRDVTTVQRWERREAMPVHRHLHDKRGSVFAFRTELDLWWESRRVRLAADEASENESAARPRWRLVVGVAAVAAVIATLGALTWLGSRADYFWQSPLANARFVRLPDLGTAQAASISGDGKLVAVLADLDGPIDIWLEDADGGNSRNLTRGALSKLSIVNPAIRALSFAADTSFVTVWTRRSDGSQTGDVNILALPIGGGELRTYLPGAAEFAWSRDGRRLVYHTTAPGDPLFVRDVAPSGGHADHRIYVAPAQEHCHFPLWSPDDDYIYFVRGVPGDGWDIWRIQPSGSGLERITTQNTRIAYPVLLDRRTILYIATDAAGGGPWLYVVDVERRSPHRISSGLESYTSLASNADGKRLVATITNPHTSLWRIDASKDRDVAAQSTPPTIIVGNGVKPRLSGDTTFYIASRAGRQGIWKLTHRDTRELWSSAHGLIMGGPAVAPDGRHIAVTVVEGGQTRLYVVDNDTGHADVITSALVLRGNLVWAPDGQALIAAVVRDGEPRLTRIALNGDSPLPLVAEYSLDPVWSPDGRFLVFSGADVGTSFPLRAAAPDGRPFPLPSLILARGSRVAFLGDAKTLVILRGEPGHQTFSAADLTSGAQRLLTELPANFVARDFDISPSGNEIVFDRIEEHPDVALIERGP